MAEPRIAIGVDVGGSGIKAAVVDADDGRFVSERLRVVTPSPSTPDAVSASIGRLVKRLVNATGIGPDVPLGLGMPGVVLGGVLKTAANIDPTWVEFPITQRLGRSLKRPVTVVNDADAAGTAEMRFGIGAGKPGVVVLLTLGTGVGSAVFIDGKLVPNTEFGQMEIRGRPAERRSASVARTKRGLSWKAWTQDLDEHLIRDRRADLARAVHPGRRGQQEFRQVRPATDGPTAGRARAAAQRRGDHRCGGDRG